MKEVNGLLWDKDNLDAACPFECQRCDLCVLSSSQVAKVTAWLPAEKENPVSYKMEDLQVIAEP